MIKPIQNRLSQKFRTQLFVFPLLLSIVPLAAGCRQADQVTARSRSTPFHASLIRVQAIEQPPVLVKIEIDAAKRSPERPDAFRAAAKAIDDLEAAMSTKGQAPAQPTEINVPSKQKWLSWSGLDAQPLETSVLGAQSLPADALVCYAAHPAGAAAVCIVNHSDQKVTTRMRIRLPRGVYKIERLKFSPPQPLLAHIENADAAHSSPDAAGGTRLDPLEGSDLASTGYVNKTLTLSPGEVCIYRCKDVALDSWLAWCKVQNALRSLQGEAPGPVRRLRRMLSEVSGGLGGLTGGKRHADTGVRLGKVHHLLLGTAQAASLSRNYQTRHVFYDAPGENLMKAFESLSSDLADTSATMLGLSPRIDVLYGPTAAAESSEGPGTSEALITIRLENTGSRSVGLVKLGLDASILPSGARCEPADLAFFGTLHPGQTVQAEFHVKRLPPAGLTEDRCVADISYFTADVPAHLRPHAWF